MNDCEHDARVAALWILHGGACVKLLRAHGRSSHALENFEGSERSGVIVADEVGEDTLSAAMDWATSAVGLCRKPPPPHPSVSTCTRSARLPLNARRPGASYCSTARKIRLAPVSTRIINSLCEASGHALLNRLADQQSGEDGNYAECGKDELLVPHRPNMSETMSGSAPRKRAVERR